MTTRALHSMIGRALTERSFREKLLLAPGTASVDFPLSEREQVHIAALRADSLEQFSQELSERLLGLADAEAREPAG